MKFWQILQWCGVGFRVRGTTTLAEISVSGYIKSVLKRFACSDIPGVHTPRIGCECLGAQVFQHQRDLYKQQQAAYFSLCYCDCETSAKTLLTLYLDDTHFCKNLPVTTSPMYRGSSTANHKNQLSTKHELSKLEPEEALEGGKWFNVPPIREHNAIMYSQH